LLRKQALLIAMLSCFVIAGPFARVLAHNELWADYGYLSCMDGIAFGCLAAMLAANIKLSNKANLAFRIGGTLLCLLITVFRGTAARLALYKAGLDVTTLEIGTALLLIALQQQFEANLVRNGSQLQRSGKNTKLTAAGKALFRSTAFLRWFGRNSYEVYLTHMFVIWPMLILFLHFHLNINAAPWLFLATTIFTGVLGYAIAQFYSEPINQLLRTRFLPKRSTQAAAVGD
jgi:peptidoglycan/LPS O-acetylase OafA/YrhL